ncbi:MAG TPA: Gfo/Idh/MocA family oxidoreductase [Candidatus Scybalocola faecigallinarum]|uniref:Gfo/Idh/MocA family oxidoreductase n=1 Tax=Candidatus Scybalocola faecigallinarum TaxID=2840941 RepID=A0A9D1F2F0_9FIRM|nr:Gfo/Idh/MocA family oxidoreductase [Candidatus Scybalocola faecigallinarum]
MDGKKLRYGVIGYGFIGRRHVNTLKCFPGVECSAVCDINPVRLEEVKVLYPEIPVYTSAREMLDCVPLDGVIIAANNNQHKELAVMAARAGVHILVEKPAALSVAELDEMTRAAADAGVTFTVHQQRRFDKDFACVRECYNQKLVGDIYTIKSALYGYNGNMHDWHVYKSEGGGMLYDWGVHLIDQILYMVDSRLVSVYADVRNVINKEVDDYFKILLRFENMVTAEIELGTYFLSDQKDWFERHWFVGGNTGSMYVDKFDPQGKIVRTTRLLENVAKDQDKSLASYGPTRSFGVPEPGLIVTEDLPSVNSEQSQFFVNYFKAVRGEEEFLVTIPQVRRVLAVMEACRKSAQTMESIVFE